jgi:NADH-quinone oxidoreductase subunit N
MASATLIAAFGALLRVFYVAFGGMAWDWRPMMWIVAILTMVVASVIAVTQRDIKRLLAYSSVVHAGFILTALVAASAEGLSGALFYLAAYGFVTVGAFAVVTQVRVRDGGAEAGDITSWAGLGRTHPWLAGALTLCPE